MSAPESPPASTSRKPEIFAAVGSAMLGVGLFLPWYATDPDRPASNIDGVRGELSGWTVHEAMRYVILAFALIQLGLALAAMRNRAGARELAEGSMVTAVNAVGVVFYFGLIYRPGEPPATIELRYGWFVAAAGVLIALVAVVNRVQKSSRRRSGSPIAQTSS